MEEKLTIDDLIKLTMLEMDKLHKETMDHCKMMEERGKAFEAQVAALHAEMTRVIASCESIFKQ